ncbi:MAG: hypothetical protein ACOYN0_12975 [Phycisphaerales bacterium]
MRKLLALTASLPCLAWNALAQPVLITAPATVGPTATTIIDQASGLPISLATAQITIRGTTLTMSGRHTIASLAIERSGANPGVLTHPAAASFDYSGAGTDIVEGLQLTITGSATIQGSTGGVASRIDLDGRGFAGGAGPGAGTASNNGGVGGTGGGFGGNGATSQVFAGGTAYGDPAAPVRLGSGGGNFGLTPAGAGGGALKLTTNGTLTLDGSISAGGLIGSSAAGCGSGGSVWIVAGSFAGNGTIAANGGTGSGWGGGGGGRVYVQYTSSTFVGTLQANGGASPSSNQRGGAGTVFIKPNTQSAPDVRITAGASAGDLCAPTPLAASTWNSLSVEGVSNLQLTSPLSVANSVVMQGGARMTLSTGQNLISGSLLMSGGGNTIANPQGSLGSLRVLGDLTIDAGSAFNGDGRGFGAGQGPGAGTASNNGGIGGAGAGHGGTGATSAPFAGGVAYGSIDAPVTVGSGGGAFQFSPGGAGGGAFRIEVPSGTFAINGSVRVDGLPPGSSAGCGSGGSIWISAANIAGSGIVSASGGSAGWGGGSGGRIAVYYASSSFNGALRAFGGSSPASAQGGAAGTIYIKPASQLNPDLVVDAGATSSPRVAITPVAGDRVYRTVVERGASNLALTSALQTEQSLTLQGSSWLTFATGQNSVGTNLTLSGAGNAIFNPLGSRLDLTVIDDITIDTGSAISADGRGFAGGQGPGAGGASNNGGIGAAGGAYGGNGAFAVPFAGGSAYGSYSQPDQVGSGGGAYVGNPGGAGAGAAKITVGGTLTVNGAISANGVVGVSSSGCGSGGGLWIIAPTIAGNGSISANGGFGSNWGGGGGGRIALYYDATSFTGTVRAAGGSSPSGGQRGGAGTIFRQASSESNPDLELENLVTSGDLSAETAVVPEGPFRSVLISGRADCRFTDAVTVELDTTVQNSARLTFAPSDNVVLDDVTVAGAGSTIFTPAQSRLDLFVGGDVTVGPGAAINGDGRGFPAGQGPGRGTASNNGGIGGAGGGYGGVGAAATPFAGGQSYGSATQPFDLGSGGGSYVGNSAGAGGGAIRLAINGSLTVDGTITARGAQPPNSSGAGSGGSIFLDASGLIGSGTVNANGGAAGSGSWGAGGGGRVAVYSCAVTMPLANITAGRGTTGGSPAGNGTITFGSSSVTVLTQPQSLAILSGLPIQFECAATTSQPGGTVSYRWRKRDSSGEFIPLSDNGRVTGTGTGTITFLTTECSDAGVYDCLVTDSCGAFPSNAAVITVDPIADYNDDGGVDGDDVIDFFADWDNGLIASDLTGDGGVDGDDVIFFFGRWDIGC